MEEELKQKLFRNTESGWNETTPEQREEITALSDKYMAFLNKAKTEREFIKRAKELGYNIDITSCISKELIKRDENGNLYLDRMIRFAEEL